MIKKALLLASVLCVLNQTPVKAETYVEPYSHVTIEITEDYVSSNNSFGSIELNGKYIQLPCKASLIFNLGFAPEEDMQVPSKSVVYWFHVYDSQGRTITMDMYNPKDTSVDLDECIVYSISYRPEEDVKVGYLDYSIMGVSRDTNPASLCTLLGEPSNKNTYSGVTDIRWESGKQERSVDIRYEADVIKSITAEVRTPEEVFDYQYYDEVGLFSLTGDGYESSVPVKLPTLAVVILLVGVTGGICRVLWRHRRQKRTQEILNTPLDELADSVLKKYGEEDDA
jgi:hypothetical protein